MRSAALPAFITPTASASPLSNLTQALTVSLAVVTSLVSPTPPAEPPAPTAAAHQSVVQRGTSRRVVPAFSITLPRLRRDVRTPEQREAELSRRKLIDEAWSIFQERFVDQDTIDWRRLRRRLEARPCDSEADQHRTLEWLFSHADDPFTRYLSAEQLESMKDDIDGEMCGVGIIFNAETQGWRRTKRVTIKDVVRNSPAADAGLQRGDQITAIDMMNVSRMSVDEAMMRLLGKEGKKVLISFRRCFDGLEVNVLLTRRRFEVPTVSVERLHAPGVGDITYLQVREFAAKTAAQTRAAVRALGPQRSALFLLDMRGNSGGLVDKAVEVAKVFLERDNIVVRFVGRDGAMTTERCGWHMWWRTRVRVTEEPVVILVDGETASAAELVAAALRDNCRAVVIGNCTFGKGSVQAIVPLSDGAGVAVTVARYRTPRDEGIVMGRGLRPDLFRNNLAADGDEVVKQLFGRGGARRYRWIVSKLGKCSCPSRGKGADARTAGSVIG